MTGPVARDPHPGEEGHRKRWRDADVVLDPAAEDAIAEMEATTVSRAPVEALLNVLDGYSPHDMPPDRRCLDALVAELRRHLDGDTDATTDPAARSVSPGAPADTGEQ